MKYFRFFLFLLLISFSIPCYGIETIRYQDEKIFFIPVTNEQISFKPSEEGIYGLSAPAVLADGSLFVMPTDCWEKKFIIKENTLSVVDIDPDDFVMGNPISQNGYIIGNFKSINLSDNNKSEILDMLRSSIGQNSYLEKVYFVPKGIVFHWNNRKTFRAIDFSDSKELKVINDFQLNNWLITQNGNYTYDEDKHILFRNGIEWSSNYEEYKYIGKLRSGHNVYLCGDSLSTEGIYITDSTNEVVLYIDFEDETLGNDIKPIITAIGNYGEFYLTIYPRLKVIYSGDSVYYSVEEKNFDISCVRNHLKYFGVLTDDRICLRSEASTSSESLGTYSINTGFMILEKGTKQETIGGDTGVWYKVRLLDGKEGWFFGAYVRDLYDGPGTPLPWPNVADWN